jgi:hypothetical protein
MSKLMLLGQRHHKARLSLSGLIQILGRGDLEITPKEQSQAEQTTSRTHQAARIISVTNVIT